jgi:RNA polymerase sigma-70 factor (ECF subfamily)
MWPNADETRELLLQAEKGGNEAIDRLLSRHRQALRRMVELRLDRALARRVAPVISSRTRFSKPAAGLNPT